MGIREEIASINRQSQTLGQIREEIFTEGAEFWERLELQEERNDWEAEQQVTREYEKYLDRLALESDAESLGMG